MSNEEFKFSDKTIPLKRVEDLSSYYKIRSYKTQLSIMEENKIPQKDIIEVLNDFFLKNKSISENTKKSISKIIYCVNDRIIITITKHGKDIITARNKLMKNYGWFFYVSDSDRDIKKRRPKKKRESKVEKTISVEVFQFEDLVISLKQKVNMRALYRNKEYSQYTKLIKSKNIVQVPIKETLNEIFFNIEFIPVEEKKAIRKIIYYQEEKVIVFKALIGDQMYQNLETLVKKFGWYFYITGVPVGKSEISLAIDKIEKRFAPDHFSNISLVDDPSDSRNIRVTIYPIVLNKIIQY